MSCLINSIGRNGRRNLTDYQRAELALKLKPLLAEQVATLVFCRCAAQYLYALRRLPDDMLTEKGRQMLNGVSKFTTNNAV